ncbi:MAG: queuosine precursor transporter [Opitutaceae bacterium]|nr:queuosine precursor transporter [Opitutaceae bacterium]
MTARQLAFPALAMAAIVLLSNLLVQFPLNAWLTWGAFSYPVAYFVTDVCNRLFGPKTARQVAWVGFAIGLISSALLAPLRIALASGTAFIVSQLLDVSIFNSLRQKSWWQAPFIGSCVASIIDTAIFFSLAFAGTEMSWLHLAIGDLGVKLAMAALLLPAYRALITQLVTR